jgi:hypothetical protein
MPNTLSLYLDTLTPTERDQLHRLARDAGMSIPQWVEYSLKSQIYRNAEELLGLQLTKAGELEESE